MRFTVTHPPVPLDAIYDTALDDGRCAGTVPPGHGPAFVAGAEYEHDRVMNLLVEAGMTAAVHLISA